MKLTQKVVDTLTLPARQSEVIVFDTTVPGFGLRLRVTGGRSFIFQYKIGSQQRRVTLGNAGAIKLEQARATASKLHAQVRLGHDVAAERSERRAHAVETFGAVLAIYLPRQKARVRPRSYIEIERYLRRYLQSLHGLQFARIDRRAIAEQLSLIETVNGKAAANRARTCLSAFFAWAVREGLTDNNPVIGTGRREEASRFRVLTSAELRIIWSALGDDEFSAIVRLLTLTGQRREEIGSLCWSEVDLEAGVIRLPAERVKNKREHTIPLSAPARTIVEAQPRRDGRDHVFGRGAGGFSGWSRCKARLDRRIAEMVGHPLPAWILHDLRRSTVTGMAELGLHPHVIEAVINHVSGSKAGIAGIYNRSTYEREKSAALARWAEHVLATVEERASKIVALRA
jgi:integrase